MSPILDDSNSQTSKNSRLGEVPYFQFTMSITGTFVTNLSENSTFQTKRWAQALQNIM